MTTVTASFGRRALGKGFTLVEMLVTLAIVAMIASLLWQGMQAVFRVERLLQASGADEQIITVRREWIRGVIRAGEVEPLGAERQWRGDGLRLQLASTEAVNLPGLRGHRVALSLSDAPAGSLQTLSVEDLPLDAGIALETPPRFELLRWRGSSGRMRYLDAQGRWQDQWPPPAEPIKLTGIPERDLVLEAHAQLPRLPVAVWIDLGAEAGGALVAEVATTEPGRLRRLQWEKQ